MITRELLNVRGLEKNTDNAFRRKLIMVADSLGLTADYLAAVMSFETAGTFRASIRNPHSGAVGLIQFLPSTAQTLGTTTAELAAMSPAEQLDYVAEYFRRVGTDRIVTSTDHYMAVFSPAFIGRPDETVMYETPSNAYTQNAGLDLNRDGKITVGEVSATFHRVIEDGEAKPPIVVDMNPKTIPVVLAGSIVLAVAAVLWWKDQQ